MEFPKYVLKEKKLNKKKSVIIFRRNYLSINEFIKTESGWIFEEEFDHYGTKCKFMLRIDTTNLAKLFSLNTKTVKVKGRLDCFSIFLRCSNRKMPFEIDKKCELVQFHLECSGKRLSYDDGTGIKNTRKKQIDKKMLKNGKQKKSDKIAPYTNAGYALTHPFQGGGVSPR